MIHTVERLHALPFDSVMKGWEEAKKIADARQFRYGQILCIEMLNDFRTKFGTRPLLENQIHQLTDSLYELTKFESSWKAYRYYLSYLKAIIHANKSQYDSAIYFFKESLSFNTADSFIYYKNLRKLAVANDLIGNSPVAVNYLKRAIPWQIKNGDTQGLIISNIALYGYFSHIPNSSDSALFYLRQAKNYALSDTTKYSDSWLIINYNLGHYYGTMNLSQEVKKYHGIDPRDSAIYYFTKCADLQSRHPDKFHSRLLSTQLSIANCYYLKRDIGKAWYYFKQVANSVQQQPDHSDVPFYRSYWYNGFLIHKARGEYLQACNLIEEGYAFEDSLHNSSLRLQFQDLEKELTKLSGEKAILEKQKQVDEYRKANVYWGAAAIIVCILSFVFYITLKQRRRLEALNNERKVLHSKLEERERIAQEIHDDVGSTITSMSMALELFSQDPADMRHKQRIDECSEELQSQMNEVIWRIRTGNDYLQNLCLYIHRFAKRFITNAGLVFNYTVDIPDELLDMDGTMRHVLYISTKEILNNIVKHAKATSVSVAINYTNGSLTIVIEDDGVGFDMQQVRTKRLGNGIRNLERNIHKLGGQITWTVHSGTRVSIIVPLTQTR